MRVLILLFLFIVVTCQAQKLPLNRWQVARGGGQESELSLNDQLYEKLKILAKKYMIDDAGDPNILTLLVPDLFKTDSLRSRERYERPSGRYVNSGVANPATYHQYPNSVSSRINNPAHWDKYSMAAPAWYQNLHSGASRFTTPKVHSRFLISEADQLRQEAQRLQQAQAERAERLAQVDRDALSKLSEEDRKILESKLSPNEREALLTRLEDGQLDDILPREENRFGGFGASMGGFSGAVAQIGASAGGYIGGKLAGTLGAKLGAAAGAYLGAAAASRFVKKTSPAPEVTSNDNRDDDYPNQGPKYGASSDGYGAVMVNNK